MIDRRSFLARLLGSTAAIIAADKNELLYALEKQGMADPEQALWRPESKTLFLPQAHEQQIELVRNEIVRAGAELIKQFDRVVVQYGDGSRETYSDLNPWSLPTSKPSAYGQRPLNPYVQFGGTRSPMSGKALENMHRNGDLGDFDWKDFDWSKGGKRV